MSTVLDAIRIRRCYPVKGVEGAYVRSLTRGELKRISELPPDLKDEFLFGCVLTDAKGNAAFTQEKSETDEAFAKRVGDALLDMDTQTRNDIGDAVARIGKVPDVETIAKN